MLGKEHPDTLESLNDLAALYRKQRHYDKAEPLFIKAQDGRQRKLGEQHPDTIETIENLAELYEAWSKPQKAKEWRAKLPAKQDLKEQ